MFWKSIFWRTAAPPLPPKNNVALEKGKCFRPQGNNLESSHRRSFIPRQHCFRGARGARPVSAPTKTNARKRSVHFYSPNCFLLVSRVGFALLLPAVRQGKVKQSAAPKSSRPRARSPASGPRSPVSGLEPGLRPPARSPVSGVRAPSLVWGESGKCCVTPNILQRNAA